MGRAASAAIGAVLAALLLVPGPQPPWLWPALAAFAAIAIVGATSRTPVGSPTSWRSALAACLGALAVAIRLAVGSGAPAAVELPDGDGPWQVIVEGVAAPRDGRQPATLRLEDGSELRLAATLPRLPEIVPGDRVEVSGRLEALSDDAYGAYLGRIGVRATIFSRTIRILPRPPAMLDLEAVRREASRALAATIPEPEAGLAAGIVIGLRDRVDRDLAAAFTTAGASHVVAISGWNIAIVAASVAALGGRFGRRRRSILTVVAITAYVVFVGASPSVLRAAAMAGIVLLARESGRAGGASAALGWAAVAILIADPALVRDAGFQLSTLATAGLLAWSKPLGDRIERLIGKRLPSWLIENLAVSLAAQAATTPVVLASFGRLSLVAPVVGVVVVPLVAPAMAAAGVALAAGLAASFGPPSALATLAGLPAWVFLSIIVATVRAASALPFASIELQPPLDVVAAGLSSLLLLALAIRSTRCRMLRAVGAALGDLRIGSIRGGARRVVTRPPRRASQQGWRFAALEKLAALALAGAVIGCGAVVLHRADGRTRIVVLDVGQGDAILVEGSRGSRLLVDGGPDPDRLLVAVDERLPPWDRQIDTLILTHPHEDHVAGLAILLARYRVARVYEPGMHGPGPGYAGWASELAAREIPAGRLATGDRMTLDDARFTVLWPDPGRVPAEPPDTGTGINNVSIVLLGDVAGRRFLLAGDIEEEIDPVLIGRGLPGVDVLKVAHHGSRTSSTDAFLDAVRPKIAIASAGAGNPYGHPAPGTIARLKAHGARVLRTDEDGTVEVTVEAARIGVRSSGPRRGASAPSARAASLDGIAVAAGFACGISRPAPAASRSGAAALARTSIAAAPATPMGPAGPDPVLLYDPSNVGPRSDGSRRTSPLGRSLARSRASLERRRRGRRLAGDAHRARQDAGRSTPRRGCRAPP